MKWYIESADSFLGLKLKYDKCISLLRLILDKVYLVTKDVIIRKVLLETVMGSSLP